MSTNPVEIRLARLEGSYEQIDKRLGAIEGRLGNVEAKIDGLALRLDAKIDSNVSELRRELGTLSSRLHTALYGVIMAILVPILIRVFFP